MALRALVLSCILLLVSTSALAQRGPPGGGPPGANQGAGSARGGPGTGTGGPGGAGGKPPHAPPLNLTAIGNLTADVGARLANSAPADQTIVDGRFHLAIFKNATGNYNLLVEALLVDAAGSPPDSLAIVQGAVCDAAATDVLALPLAAADWQQRAGWWLLHAEARLDAFLENADAATVDALLAVLPNASLPRKNGGGRNGGGSAGGAQSGQGGRRMGRELLMHAVGRVAKQGGQQQGGAQQGGAQQGGAQQGGAQQPPAGGFSGGDGGVNNTVSGYAVLAGSSAAGVTWGGQLMGAKVPAAAV